MGCGSADEDEVAGLDLSQHSETAYMLGGGSYGEYGEAAALAELCADGGP